MSAIGRAVGQWADRVEIRLHGDQVDGDLQVEGMGVSAHVETQSCGRKALVIEPPPATGVARGSTVSYRIMDSHGVIAQGQFHRTEMAPIEGFQRMKRAVVVSLFGSAMALNTESRVVQLATAAMALVGIGACGMSLKRFCSRWQHQQVTTRSP